MKKKLDEKIERPTAEQGVSPWYTRRITAPLWAVLINLGAIAGLTAILIMLGNASRLAQRASHVPAAAVFLKTDTTTQGNWKDAYGSAGFVLANEGKGFISYGEIAFPGGNKPVTWEDRIDSIRAPEKLRTNTRIAAAWWGWDRFDIDLNLADDKTHRVALYVLDWDSNARVENIEVLDALTGNTLDVRQAAKFTNGQYLIWSLRGHVILRVKHLNGANAVASGVFFD